jgi:hypothetical protein
MCVKLEQRLDIARQGMAVVPFIAIVSSLISKCAVTNIYIYVVGFYVNFSSYTLSVTAHFHRQFLDYLNWFYWCVPECTNK